jgi:predicted enzyme involved in methoxymalonyl-ACP biosynthesis
LIGEYQASAKNELVRSFYSQHAFTAGDEEGQLWLRSLLPLDSFIIPSYLHLAYAE